MQFHFPGATGTATRSRYVIRTDRSSVLADCGLLQDYKRQRLCNRAPLTVEPSLLDAVVFTHARLHDGGYIPFPARNGIGGRIYCSDATFDLCKIMPPDSDRPREAGLAVGRIIKTTRRIA